MIYVADKDTGTFICKVSSVERGKEMIEDFENEDRKDGIYTTDFYDVVDEDHNSLLRG